jgi:hypothetical protein
MVPRTDLGVTLRTLPFRRRRFASASGSRSYMGVSNRRSWLGCPETLVSKLRDRQTASRSSEASRENHYNRTDLAPYFVPRISSQQAANYLSTPRSAEVYGDDQRGGRKVQSISEPWASTIHAGKMIMTVLGVSLHSSGAWRSLRQAAQAQSGSGSDCVAVWSLRKRYSGGGEDVQRTRSHDPSLSYFLMKDGRLRVP